MPSDLCITQNGAVGVTDQGAVIMVNNSRRRAFTARRLILLATMANLGIAALVVGGAFVPAFSKAQAAERPESNSPFPQNSEIEGFFRRFGVADAGQDTRGWMGVEIQPVTAEIADSLGLKTSDGAL